MLHGAPSSFYHDIVNLSTNLVHLATSSPSLLSTTVVPSRQPRPTYRGNQPTHNAEPSLSDQPSYQTLAIKNINSANVYPPTICLLCLQLCFNVVVVRQAVTSSHRELSRCQYTSAWAELPIEHVLTKSGLAARFSHGSHEPYRCTG
jgi:hypothetical protein